MVAPAHDAREVEAGVADAFELAYFAHHLAQSLLGVVAQVSAGHLFEEACYLYFHAVGELFLLAYLLADFVHAVVFGFGGQFAHVVEHLMEGFGKALYFALCLQDGDFGCLHEVGLYVFESEVVVGIGLVFLGQYPAHDAFYLRYESYEQGGVGHVEACVEHGEHHWQPFGLPGGFGVVSYE